MEIEEQRFWYVALDDWWVPSWPVGCPYRCLMCIVAWCICGSANAIYDGQAVTCLMVEKLAMLLIYSAIGLFSGTGCSLLIRMVSTGGEALVKDRGCSSDNLWTVLLAAGLYNASFSMISPVFFIVASHWCLRLQSLRQNIFWMKRNVSDRFGRINLRSIAYNLAV